MNSKNFFELSTGERQAFLVKKAQVNNTYSVIIEFLLKNPGIYNDLKGLSICLGLNMKDIEFVVQDMIAIGILKNAKIGNMEVMYLNENKVLISDFEDAISTMKKDIDNLS